MSGFVSGPPKTILRLEGLAVLALTTFAYTRYGAGWSVFALGFLVPDLSMLGYVFGKKSGAHIYNIGHSYLIPMGLLAYGVITETPLATSAALIWTAHIGLDRLLGYGLKYTQGFGLTHLGLKGKAAKKEHYT
ncbi:hypothetical protein MMA231_02917 [Asticcacaulis sp. MM231]|uniref:DUF4260 domain-containing protein n=1 Tax=Asticcacaulis sp. MM231 TaxID=3157666 RepID=UPI0032D56D46